MVGSQGLTHEAERPIRFVKLRERLLCGEPLPPMPSVQADFGSPALSFKQTEIEGYEMESYVRNCHVVSKDGDDVLFTERSDGTVAASLDGYAIIPLAEYERLLSLLSAGSTDLRLEFVAHRDVVGGPYLHWVYLCDSGDTMTLGRGETPLAAKEDARKTLDTLLDALAN